MVLSPADEDGMSVSIGVSGDEALPSLPSRIGDVLTSLPGGEDPLGVPMAEDAMANVAAVGVRGWTGVSGASASNAAAART